MNDIPDIHRRDDLPPLERAVSDTLDEWLHRIHGIVSGWAHPYEFLLWLRERGYDVVMQGLPAFGETCRWKRLDITTDEDDIVYKTQCGDNHVSTYDAIYNGYKHCPYCGREIQTVK